jgi:hypothetical protein
LVFFWGKNLTKGDIDFSLAKIQFFQKQNPPPKFSLIFLGKWVATSIYIVYHFNGAIKKCHQSS